MGLLWGQSSRGKRASWSLIAALVFAGWMWVLLPPVPRTAWPVKGETMVLSADGRRLVTKAMTWVKQVPVPGVLSGGGPPPAERCDLHVYDVAEGRELAVFSWDHVEIRPVAVSADGRRLAALTIWGNRIREWDIDTQEEVGRYGPGDFLGKDPWAMHLSYSPAGDLLATVRVDDQQCVLWHCRERRIIANLNGKGEFAPNDFIELGFLIADAGKGRWKVWRLDTGAFTGEFPKAPDGFSSPSHIALSADGKLLVHGSRHHLQFFHADGTTRELTPFNASHVPVLSPDSNLLAVFAWQNLRDRKPNVLEWLRIAKPPERWSTLKLHSLHDGREIAAFAKGNVACFAPDCQALLVLNDDQTLQVWDIPPRPPWWHIAGVGALAGGLVLLGGRLWRRRVVEQVAKPL